MIDLSMYRQGLLHRLEKIEKLDTDAILDIADWIRALDDIEAFWERHDKYSDIRDELGAAEKYHDQWKATGNVTYQNIGLEELKHAKQIMDILKNVPKDLLDQYDRLMKKLK